jgi:RimJ/RimL family protein N-acetyltransferase
MRDSSGDVRTARLVLHRILPAEAARIVAGAPGPDDRWHPEYPFEDELAPLGSLVAATAPDPVFTLYQVQDAQSGLAIGGIGFFGPPDPEGAVEFGYGLVAAARGRGLATEAVRAVARLAAQHGAVLLRADTTPANAASQRVLEKAGLIEVRRTDDLVWFERRLEPAAGVAG